MRRTNKDGTPRPRRSRLVLSRAVDQTIEIDHPAGMIEVTVAQLGHNKCKLSIVAPEEVRILRQELKRE